LKSPVVYQFAPQICPFDAVGNEIFALKEIMAEIGIESEVTCELADPSLRHSVRPWSEIAARKGGVTVVHYSHGSAAHEKIFGSVQPKILLYHNVTPAKYFRGAHPNLVRASEMGNEQISKHRNAFEAVIAHSRYSAGQLEELGFSGIKVLPYVCLPKLYEIPPDVDVIRRYGQDRWVNIICVGQVSPHKCLEDSILVYDYFKRRLCSESRLIIVGGWAGTEAYLRRLQRLVNRLGIAEVIFTGQVSMNDLVAYYRCADLFLCMSEHEGFCVPLVEAMRYEVPIFAYQSTAIPETLCGTGVLFPEKDWSTIAEAMAVLLESPERRKEIIAAQRDRSASFSWNTCRERFREFFRDLGLPTVGQTAVAGNNTGSS